MSVESPQSGIILRIAATRSRYHSRVYLRFISFKILSLPLCTGRWICLHTLGISAITRSVSSLMSFGCDVVKRTRISGTSSATRRRRAGKRIVFSFLIPHSTFHIPPSTFLIPPSTFHLYEFTFCPSRVTSLYPLSLRSRTSRRMLSISRLRSRPLV